MKKQSLQRLASRLMKERIDLPEQKIGEYEIVHEQHKKGDKLMVVGFREAIFTGLPVTDYLCAGPVRIHKMKGPEGTWMSDLPCELVQMHRELACHARGRVLVGGLGLGIVSRMCALNPRVTEVVTVERQAEVIKLISPYLNGKSVVMESDIHEYVKRIWKGRFDVALLDTWQGTGEWVWQTEVVPLRRALYGKIPRVHCWAEDVMINQVYGMLNRVVSLPIELFCDKSRCHYYAFAQGVKSIDLPVESSIADFQDFKRLLEIEEKNKKNAGLQFLIRRFLTEVGSPYWETTFGKYWDEAWESERKSTVGIHVCTTADTEVSA